MKSTSTLGILFFIRKERASDDKHAAIYLRITVNGKRAELSIKRQVEINKWNNAGGSVKGNSEESKQLNEYLSLWRNKVYKAQKDLLDDSVLVTSEAIKNLILGKTEKHKTLVEVFEYHNKLLAEKVGIDHAQGTLDRYTTALKHVKEFMQYTYRQNDVFLANLNYKFVSDFHHYLVTVRKCNQNTTAKYIKNVKRILNVALKNEWLDKDPFVNFINTVKPVERDYLTTDELSTLENKQIAIQRLDNVRDIFVFSCYTGLAYIDVAELTPQNISKGIDGEMWINTHRHL